MVTDKSIMVRSDVTQWHAPIPILATVGPLLGLGYIVVMPFIGITAFILTISYRTAQSLVAVWHRSTQSTI